MRRREKSFLSYVLTAVMILAVMPVFSFPMRAKAETLGDFEYVINEEGEITITEYTGSDTDIVIPAEIDEKPVVEVYAHAFINCRNNTSVTFEGNIKTISGNANYSTALKKVTFEGNVDKIGEFAFYNCANLTSVTFEGNVDNIGAQAFSNCGALASLKFEGNVVNIGSSAFSNCDKLTSVEGNVVNVGSSAFHDCDALASVKFEGNVVNIGSYAFEDCDALESFKFEGNEVNFDSYAFRNCDKLTSVEGNVVNIGGSAFEDCDALESFKFEGNEVNISSYAFYHCDNLKSVEGNVVNIGDSAFYDCDALASVKFEGNVVNIGSSAFEDCDALESFKFEGNEVNFDFYAFGNCDKLTSVEGNVVNIGYSAFYDCDALESFKFEGNEVNISSFAFYHCDNLKSLKFEGNVDNIEGYAFGNCYNLENVFFSGDVGAINKEAFYMEKDCNLNQIILPQSSNINPEIFPSNPHIIKFGFDSDTYTGQAIPFVVKVDGVADSSIDYTVTYKDAKEVKDAGDYTAEFTMTNPAFGPIEIKHTVKPLDLSTCTVDFGGVNFTYDGIDQKESVIGAIKLINVDGKEIEKVDGDYTFEFEKKDVDKWNKVTECIEPGNYRVTIHGCENNCTNDIQKEFTIKKADNLQIGLEDYSCMYDGKVQLIDIRPSSTAKGGDTSYEYYIVIGEKETPFNGALRFDKVGSVKIRVIATNPNYSNKATTTATYSMTPKTLTITADSDTKCFGSTLIKESCTNTGLAYGDYIDSIIITGSQTDVGSSENVPKDAVIKNRAGEDVTSCYDITYLKGTLTVEDHVFDLEDPTEKYLAVEADQTHGNIYYYRCKCGETGTETFEAGEPLPTYTIIFDANGGSIEPVSAETNSEYKLDSLPTPEYDGYNFLGWFTNETGGDEITTDTVFGANMTIYAHWEKKEEPKPAQGGTEKPETPTEPSVPETPATPETPSTPSEPETEDVKEETKSDYLDELYALLREAIAKGEEQTINWSAGDSLPYDVMKILEENPQITLVFNYTYMGEDFNVTIRGRDVQADPKVKWCGPLYLYSIYGGYKGDENGLKENGKYIVQAGDTLSALATKFNTTIKNLVALNNIKDENLIFIGQELKY